MAAKFSIAVVDDDDFNRFLLAEVLAEEFSVRSYASGGDFLAASLAHGEPAQVVLLDIEMPGLNGYEVCRRLQESGQAMPTVIFVSAHDTVEERLEAFSSGGEDFICKPVQPEEMLQRVRVARRRQEEQAMLRNQAEFAQRTACTAMTAMGDQGLVLDFMRRSDELTNLESLGRALGECLRSYGLTGTLYFDSSLGALGMEVGGGASPLTGSVLGRLRHMGRLVSLRSRLVVNFERVSLLVQNMPWEDEEQHGRLQANLCLLAETVDSRIRSLELAARSQQRQVALYGAVVEIRQVLQTLQALQPLESSQQKACQDQLGLILALLDRVESLFQDQDLAGCEEKGLELLVHEARDEALGIFTAAPVQDQRLGEILGRLETLCV